MWAVPAASHATVIMHKFGSEYFNSTTQNKKWGVREWFNTVSQSLGGNTSDIYSNYSLAHVYLPSTPNGGGPFVETGYYKGYGSTYSYSPAW
jgi:hypothetical protein